MLANALLAFPEGLDDSKSVLLQLLAGWPGQGSLQDDDGVLGIDEYQVVGELDNEIFIVGLDRNDCEEGGLTIEIFLSMGLDLGTDPEACLLDGLDPLPQHALQIGAVILFDGEQVDREGAVLTGSVPVKDRSIRRAFVLCPVGRNLEGEALLGEGSPLCAKDRGIRGQEGCSHYDGADEGERHPSPVET